MRPILTPPVATRRMPYSPRVAGGNRRVFNRSTNHPFPPASRGYMAICHTTHHTTYHKATFATLRVKASSSRRNFQVEKGFRLIGERECGGRKWLFDGVTGRPHDRPAEFPLNPAHPGFLFYIGAFDLPTAGARPVGRGTLFPSASTRGTMRTRRTRQRSGSAVVEFSVVLPILVTLLLGIWEIGRMVQVKQIIDNAAREGAR